MYIIGWGVSKDRLDGGGAALRGIEVSFFSQWNLLKIPDTPLLADLSLSKSRNDGMSVKNYK